VYVIFVTVNSRAKKKKKNNILIGTNIKEVWLERQHLNYVVLYYNINLGTHCKNNNSNEIVQCTCICRETIQLHDHIWHAI
jgi:hypothetical protein